jgi:hypothetical protein
MLQQRRKEEAGKGRLTGDGDVDLHLHQRLRVLLLHRDSSEHGGAAGKLGASVQDFAVVNGIGDDVIEGVGHEKPRHASAQFLGNVVLLRESRAEFDHGDAHPACFYSLVHELSNGRLAKFARNVRRGADGAGSSGLLLGKERAGDVEGMSRAHHERDEENNLHF